MGKEQAQSDASESAKTRSGGGFSSARSGLEPGGALPVQARFLLSLQQTAGNRAVAGLVQRWRDGSGDAGLLQGRVAPVQRESAEEDEPLQGRFAPVQRQGAERRHGEAGGVSEVVQRSPINGPPHNYTATNSDSFFVPNHLGADEPEAEAKSKRRTVRGKAPPSNTVLIGYTENQIKALVLGAEYDHAINLGHPVYGIVITCDHVTHTLRQGSSDTQISGTTGVVNGTVTIKVYFDEKKRKISLTGIEPGS